MRHDEKEVRKILDQSMAAYRDLSQEEIGIAVDRVWGNLRPEMDSASKRVQTLADFRSVRSDITRRRWRWPMVATIAAAIAIAVVIPVRMLQQAPAVLEGTTGSRRIEFGEVVRSNGSTGETLLLADGSGVEMRSKSELLLERADDGVRILLRNGGIIVNAAKQRKGHLYVLTKDVTVAVVGTVFLVNAEEEGSRVGVIEGEVRLQDGETEKKLRSGDQVTTSPAMESVPLKDEFAWSVHAESHVASLQRAAAALLQQATATARPAEEPAAFDVESVKPSSTSPAGSGRGGPVGPAVPRAPCSLVLPPRVEIDPHRFAVYRATLRALVMSAYGKSCSFLSGGPAWVEADRFDIEAVIPEGSESYTVQQFRNGEAAKLQVMLQTLLANRFKLSLHPEMKDMEVYNLVIVNAGKMKPAEGPQDLSAALAPRLVPTLHARLTSRTLADVLASHLGRPVIDKTDLAGLFDVHVEWALQPPVLGTAPGLAPPEQSSIFPAIQDQLGLKLEPARALVETLVIDRAERPTEN